MVDPSFPELNATSRLSQVAAILARGIRRYLSRLRRSQALPEENPAVTAPNGLAVPVKPRLSVSQRFGVYQAENQQETP
jgi:hypothetical protein